MPKEDRWRGIDRPSTLQGAWTPLEIRAHQRMAELLHEAELDRIVRMARGASGSRLQARRSVAMPTLLTAVLSALVDLACRLVIDLPGRGASETEPDGSPQRFKARTMLHHGRGSTSEG